MLNFEELISIALRPVMSRLSGIVRRGVVSLVNDSLKMQQVQFAIGDEEIISDAEHFQPYGFSARPKEPNAAGKADGLILAVGGNPDHGVVICVADRRYRFKDMVAGEVALYDHLGQYILLWAGGVLIDLAGANKLDVLAVVNATGGYEVDGVPGLSAVLPMGPHSFTIVKGIITAAV